MWEKRNVDADLSTSVDFERINSLQVGEAAREKGWNKRIWHLDRAVRVLRELVENSF